MYLLHSEPYLLYYDVDVLSIHYTITSLFLFIKMLESPFSLDDKVHTSPSISILLENIISPLEKLSGSSSPTKGAFISFVLLKNNRVNDEVIDISQT